MSQAVLPEEAKKFLTGMSNAIPGDEGASIIDDMKARTGTQATSGGAATSPHLGVAPKQSIETTALRSQDVVMNGERRDAMLEDFASSVRDVRGSSDFSGRNGNAGGFERVGDPAMMTPADLFHRSIVDSRYSRAGEQYRRDGGGPRPDGMGRGRRGSRAGSPASQGHAGA